MYIPRLACGSVIVVSCFLGCATTPQGGSVKTSHNASLPETFGVVRQSIERIGFTVTKEDIVSGEIQGASPPYGTKTRQCQGNELWVYLAEAGPTRTDVVVQEWYRGGSRLLSKPKQFCEPKAPLLVSTMQSIGKEVKESPSIVTSTNGPFPATKSESQLDEAIQSLVSQLLEGIKANRVASIAVFPITDGSRGKVSPLSTYLADKITNGLYATKSTKVVERTRLVRIMEELELTASPRFDDRSVKSVGKLAGVDAVIMGSYSTVGSQIIEVNVRLISVETAELMGVGTMRIPEMTVHNLLL